MIEQWAPIKGFPRYLVSNFGVIINEESNREVRQFLTRTGYCYASIMDAFDVQRSCSVPLAVARAFLDPPSKETFDTPINLNGYREDNFVGNLMWRPRWFAVEYHRQFTRRVPEFTKPIFEVSTGEVFENSMAAAVKYGLLSKDIVLNYATGKSIWPTTLRFRPISEQ